jgi:hypothetical protein
MLGDITKLAGTAFRWHCSCAQCLCRVLLALQLCTVSVQSTAGTAAVHSVRAEYCWHCSCAQCPCRVLLALTLTSPAKKSCLKFCEFRKIQSTVNSPSLSRAVLSAYIKFTSTSICFFSPTLEIFSRSCVAVPMFNHVGSHKSPVCTTPQMRALL